MALQNAWSVGLDCSAEVARVEALVGEKCNQREILLEDLCRAVAEATAAREGGAEAGCAFAPQGGDDDAAFEHAEHLRTLRNRICEGLAAARGLNLPGSSVQDAELECRRLLAEIQDLSGQIRVFCRIRNVPALPHGGALCASSLRAVANTMVEVPTVGSFEFDGVFAPGTQAEVFEACRDLVEATLDGRSATIFAYGQTGAGKTYTMLGTDDQEGIAYRVISELFRLVDARQSHRPVRVSASTAELYNSRLYDLGAAGQRHGSLEAALPAEALEAPEVEVRSTAELRALLRRGIALRAVGANALNIESSRSHFLFTIKVCSVHPNTGEEFRGKLLLCDLGGAERLKRSEVTGYRQREAIEINKSLTALGDVIEAVAHGQQPVPYRNHRLTRILQDSIGGAAKTLMFVNCSPEEGDIGEAVMSLKYAARVQKVVNKPLARA